MSCEECRKRWRNKDRARVNEMQRLYRAKRKARTGKTR